MPTTNRLGHQRLTTAEKDTYAVDARLRTGCWTAVCPQCGEQFEATDPSVSQVGVVYAVQQHEATAHGQVSL